MKSLTRLIIAVLVRIDYIVPYNLLQRQLDGHFGDVYTCRFFPSGIVILTGGADMQLKIWSAETGQCAATLRGHLAGQSWELCVSVMHSSAKL